MLGTESCFVPAVGLWVAPLPWGWCPSSQEAAEVLTTWSLCLSLSRCCCHCLWPGVPGQLQPGAPGYHPAAPGGPEAGPVHQAQSVGLGGESMPLGDGWRVGSSQETQGTWPRPRTSRQSSGYSQWPSSSKGSSPCQCTMESQSSGCPLTLSSGEQPQHLQQQVLKSYWMDSWGDPVNGSN